MAIVETVIKNLQEREVRLKRDISMHQQSRINILEELSKNSSYIQELQRSLDENNEALQILEKK